jgi:hypothetical protein
VKIIPSATSLLLAIIVTILLVAATPLALVFSLFRASAGIAPGNVPIEATVPMVGPLRTENVAMDTLLAPWYGSRYVFGGNVVGAVDCSGFTVAVYRQLGVNLPRTAQQQFNVSRKVDEPRPLDLVFFYGTYDSRPDFVSHVGIYLGDGVMVSAVEPYLGRQDLNSVYWRSHLVSFGRVLG